MAKQLEIIQVVFNVEDPDQLQLYQHVTRRKNRSGFMKRLIQRDIDSGFGVHRTPKAREAAAADPNDFQIEGFI